MKTKKLHVDNNMFGCSYLQLFRILVIILDDSQL